jgi:Protein of unknown function (DUF3034).
MKVKFGVKYWVAGAVSAMALGISAQAMALPIMLEGAGGGGVNPWALIANGGKNVVTPAVFGTYVTTRNYNLYSAGVNFSILNKAEIYYDHQYLGLPGSLSAALATNSIEQNIIGAKFQAYGGSGLIPAIAVGINYHMTNKYVPKILGVHHNGADFYVAATGIYPVAGSNLLLDADLYVTKSNYMGLLGQGGPKQNSYHVEGGASIGYFLAKDVVLGAELRTFPTNNLTPDNGALGAGNSFKQSAWYDGYIAYMPNPHLSVVAAFVDLGNMVDAPHIKSYNANQNGFYLNLNGSF